MQTSDAQLPPGTDLVIEYDDYLDMQTYHGHPSTTEILADARNVVQNGGRVLFVTEYINAPQQINHRLSSIDDVNAWECEMMEATRQAGKNWN